jgi:hypothetical protein
MIAKLLSAAGRALRESRPAERKVCSSAGSLGARYGKRNRSLCQNSEGNSRTALEAPRAKWPGGPGGFFTGAQHECQGQFHVAGAAR